MNTTNGSTWYISAGQIVFSRLVPPVPLTRSDLEQMVTQLGPPADRELRREWIKYQLAIKGHTFASLARELGVSRHAPKSALDGPYPKMETAIASVMGVHPMVIWPERYDDEGRTNRRVGRPPQG